MGITADILDLPEAALAALMWQLELGATEAILDAPLSAYDLPDAAPKLAAPRAPAVAPTPAPSVAVAPALAPSLADAVALAQRAAQAAPDLAALRAAMDAYPHCDLRKGAKNLVFSDGQPGAPVLILGEAPGRDEDIAGRPFVGRAGQLLDRMFAAIGLDRAADTLDRALYITNVLPWRPPANRDPTEDEIDMFRPFVARHIALARPKVLVLMGNTPCQAVLQTKGILRLRGGWAEFDGLPVLPMTHPAYLLRNPAAKREAWADLLALQARLKGV